MDSREILTELQGTLGIGAFTAVVATGGIYSTTLGMVSKYSKVEGFTHDATMLVVFLITSEDLLT